MVDIPLAAPAAELGNPVYIDMGPLLSVGSLVPVSGLGFTSPVQFISLKRVECIPLERDCSEVAVVPDSP